MSLLAPPPPPPPPPGGVCGRAPSSSLVAQCCGLKAGDFVHAIGDAHVYLNHREALTQQVSARRMCPRLLAGGLTDWRMGLAVRSWRAARGRSRS